VESILFSPKGRYISEYKNKLRLPIEKIFEIGGPGVYYWPVCRTLRYDRLNLSNYRKALTPSDDFEEDYTLFAKLLSKKHRYQPYLDSWIDQYNEVQKLMNENAANENIPANTKVVLKQIRNRMNNTHKRVKTVRRGSMNVQNKKKRRFTRKV
jgi:hypothetical protein